MILKSKIVSMLVASLLVGIVLTISVPVFAKPGRGYLYYDDDIVRTFVPNGKPLQKEGTDPLYAFPADENWDYDGQYSVIDYAPGDKEYTGGHWAVSVVTWNVEPYLITNSDDLWSAEQAGDVTILRHTELDVLCPVIPGSVWNPAA
jgi:hypothetical protein